jgi:hypothetical protein
MESLARPLIVAGIVLVLLGLALQAGPSLPVLGKLPGDVRIERGGVHIFLPITSCLLVSMILSGVLWLVGKLR